MNNQIRRRGTLTAAMAMALLATVGAGEARAQQKFDLRAIGKEALKGAAIGYAVKQSAKPLNSFINTISLRQGLADKQTTKVVPMLSLGDKGYIGAAQVSGPAVMIAKTQAVWQVEGSKMIGDGVYRVKALVPSNSLSPLKISRVQKVGINAVIDVATGGPLNREGPYSRDVRGGDLVKAGAIAVAVNAAAKPLNDFVNGITLNRSNLATKVVPMATFGEKAFVGAGQLSGANATLGKAKALWQYEDLFDRGRFRVKLLIPTDGANPLKLRRVQGVGLSALIDASIQRQSATLEPRRDNRQSNPVVVAPVSNRNGGGGARPTPGTVIYRDSAGRIIRRDSHEYDDDDRKGHKNKGKKKGWYKGKGHGVNDEKHGGKHRGDDDD